MKKNVLVFALGYLFFTGYVLAEPSPSEINNYFNPRPHAYVDLDATLKLHHDSDVVAGESIARGNFEYVDFIQDVDHERKIDGAALFALHKSSGLDATFGIAYDNRSYLVNRSGFTDRMERLFGFVGQGTADPRSFWFASIDGGLEHDESSGEDVGNFGVSVGIGHGRVYRNRSFHEAWALSEKLDEIGRLLGSPTTAQLYAVARIIDERTEHQRLAEDEAHGLNALYRIRFGKYVKIRYEKIWQYLTDQGLASGLADIDAVFAMDYILNRRGFYNWRGGAEVVSGLDFKSTEDQDDNYSIFAT